ncbi:MAG TPA: hypothetical protein VIH99_01155 [Bdellovibrionota bacterium]
MRTFLALFLVVPSFSFAEKNIDLQWSVCSRDAYAVASALGADSSPKSGSITYYDSASPRFIDLGTTFRVKEQDGLLESSVKIRSRNKDGMSGDGAECEWDRYGDDESYTCEVSAEGVTGSLPWTGAQTKFMAKHGFTDWADLRAFGSYRSLGWKIKFKGYKVKFDSVTLPGVPDPIMEISIKVPRSEGDEVYREISSELRQRNVEFCPNQESRTMRIFRALGYK